MLSRRAVLLLAICSVPGCASHRQGIGTEPSSTKLPTKVTLLITGMT
jgi:hypothetical protein